MIVATAKAVSSMVSLQQSACSAILRGFGLCYATGKIFFTCKIALIYFVKTPLSVIHLAEFFILNLTLFFTEV